jgi:hypothetical protein
MVKLIANPIWFLVVSCGALLAACAQPQPGPTPTVAVAQVGPAVAATNTAVPPTATSSPPPTATSTPPPLPTPTPTIPHLYVTGAHITTGIWSPDSRWLAYWLAGDDDLRGLDAYDPPGGTLHLLNSRSKESCALPQFHATTWDRYSLAWENGENLVVQDWENSEQWRGQACRPDSFARLAEPPLPDEPVTDGSLSPDGRFRIVLELQEEEADHWRTMLTTLRQEGGGEIAAVTWRTQATFDEDDPAGQWLSPTHFFIRLADGGPLLLDADQPGHVINVQLDLFGLPRPAPDRGVAAAPGPAAGGFSLLLFGGRADAPIQLYHAASGLVETLPYHRAASPPFSPDYEWLLMFETENTLWLRRVDDVAGEWRLVGADVSNNVRWNADATEVALSQFWQVTWQTFPEGEVIGQWPVEPYEGMAQGWSPDGRFLVVMGRDMTPGSWYRRALFLFERGEE